MTGVAMTRWYGTAGATALVALGVAAAFAAAPAEYSLAGAVFIAGTLAVYRLPVLSLSALVIAGVGPQIFAMTADPRFEMHALFAKVFVYDAIMIAMMLAVLFKAASALARPGWRAGNFPVTLAVCYGALFAWIAVSVLRNLDVYGLKAASQFRFSHLILVVPAYASIFLRSSTQRRRFFAFLLVFSVAVPLAAVPVIGSMNGWGFGRTKIFGAAISLGLLYGWAALVVASESRTLRVPRWLARGLALPVAALVLVDGNRSVWLAGLVLLVYFVVIRRLSADRLARMSTLAVAVAVTLLALAGMVGLDVLSYVARRGGLFANPGGDANTAWRLDLWAKNLARWRQHPLAGDGFGSYYIGGVENTLQPHSYYVQTLVPMGAIGLALLAAVVVMAGTTLWSALKRQRNVEQEPLDAILVVVGLGILLSALAFTVAYSVDYYSCLWVGLALAAAFGLRRNEPLAAAHSPSRP